MDPWADDNEVYKEYGIHISNVKELNNIDCIVTAVAHKQYVESGLDMLKDLFGAFSKEKVLIDVKGIYDRKELELSNFSHSIKGEKE